jgi:hypothetical protein
MINYNEILLSDVLHNVKSNQFWNKVVLTGEVAANSTEVEQVNITNLGDFLCLYITGSYTTLYESNGNIIDTDICYLSGQLIDGTGNRKLFEDFIPFNLFLSPGRVRSQYATNENANPSNSLYLEMPFQHLFDKNSTIILNVKNSSNTTNYFSICFHGIRILKG